MGSPDNAEYGMLVSKVNELESALAELQATVIGLVGAGAADDHAEHSGGPRQLPLVMTVGADAEDTSIRGVGDDESDAAVGHIVVKSSADSAVVATASHEESDSDTLEMGVYYV